jgi:hypothetical protein
MFGTKRVAFSLNRLEAVLDRRTPINSLDALYNAVDRRNSIPIDLENAAIGIDSSVFLRLGGHKKRADIVDYLDTKHLGPLVLPGQAIQEFWNNQLAVVETVAGGLKKKFEALKQDATKLEPGFDEFAKKMNTLLDDFSSEYGYAYDASTLRSTSTILELLQRKAILSYVPRSRFHNIALNRKRTKTPPGFEDPADGDFFIWAEFLYGLLRAKDIGKQFSHVIFLTNDVKPDWSRANVAHPILTAEIQQLVGVPFDVLTIDQLVKKITSNNSATTQPDATTEAGSV